ncbi:Alpha/Beta hydrolase protein [Biscogniauxia marginata]|nr:Alpha/Beta hydrolase protein [Biscogniauxia marginata]
MLWKLQAAAFVCLIQSASLLVRGTSLQKVSTDFGPNPRNVGFYIYVPDELVSNPPILVNPHWCHGDAQASYAGSQYATLADRYGFIVIYPDSPNTADKCWDVSSNDTLTHNAGGDSLGIASMVRWTLDQYHGDPARVFVTGVSGYPDMFVAGSAFAGVPYGCFAGDGYGVWNDACATGKITHTGEEWAAMVKSGYPEYTGWRPKIQIFHGTADEVLNYTNFGEEVKEWTAVFGFDVTPASTILDTPVTNWTKYIYGSTGWLEAYSAGGVTHDIRNQEGKVMEWFDLTCTSGDCFKWGKDGPAR